MRGSQNVGISERIKLARKKLGIFAGKASVTLGLSRSICSQWVHNISNPSIICLMKK
jgi:hypothetical protein